MNLDQLKDLFVHAGAKALYVKPLAENDNSKNQIYFGQGFQALNLFPSEEIVSDNGSGSPIFKAKLHFGWLTENGNVVEAPYAQFILYPQYPEVRFSGFLKGCPAAPSELMAGRFPGRILFLGVAENKRIIGFAAGQDSEVAREFRTLALPPQIGVFNELDLPAIPSVSDSQSRLLAEMGRIHRLGWIDSKQLDSNRELKPCNAPQCGGYTLEAELGISKNSSAEPDFLGWEIKQYKVSDFDRPYTGGAITLMTPEPNGGFYHEHGVQEFVRRFGYIDKMGRADRMNFGCIHRVGDRQATTHLTMTIIGYDAKRGLITNAGGAVALVTDSSEVAASWAFDGLLSHWSRKHMRAAYVPSQCRMKPVRQYSYGHRIRLAQRTDPLLLLHALASGIVFYDPGIKLENISGTPQVKRRSQFRIASKNINALYETVDIVEV
jgi:hypothetical protein